MTTKTDTWAREIAERLYAARVFNYERQADIFPTEDEFVAIISSALEAREWAVEKLCEVADIAVDDLERQFIPNDIDGLPFWFERLRAALGKVRNEQ